MTRMGGLRKKMPITNLTYLVSVLSIAGFPFTAGFMSKDLILQSLWMGNGVFDEAYKVIFVVLAFAAGMTAAYMARNYLLTFWTKPRDKHIYDHAHESPWTMTVPLVVLATMAIAAGYGWHAVLLPQTTEAGIVTTQFQGTFDPDGDLAHSALGVALGVSLFVAFTGLVLGWIAYQTEKGAVLRVAARRAIAPVYDAANRLYFMDDICEFLIIRTTVLLGAFSAWADSTLLDIGLVDGIGRTAIKTGDASGRADDVVVDGAVNSVAGAAYGGGGVLSAWQSGRVRNYLFGAVGTAALFAFLVLYATRS
jgi:NADH-quinone oxidoreductase subunit L